MSMKLYCRGAIGLDVGDGEIMYMPAGVQEITPSQRGRSVRVSVLVDRGAVDALNAQREALEARGTKPYFDFNHDDQGASFWVKDFVWRDFPQPGIYARGEFTDSGLRAVTGKDYRQFSPVFHVDDTKKRPARIVCQKFAKPNMGGLVNDPAFKEILPLWAKAAGAHSSDLNQNETKQDKTNMKKEELAVLQAKIKQMETQLSELQARESALKAKNQSDDLVAEQIKAKQAELKAAQMEVNFEEVKARAEALEASEKSRREQSAQDAVNAAIERGAIAAKDEATQKHWLKIITEDPEASALLAKVGNTTPVNGGRLTGSEKVSVTKESPNATMKAYAALVARNAAIPVSNETTREKDSLARAAATLYAKDIAGDVTIESMTPQDALHAADNSDASIGLLSGTLVLQEALNKLAYEYDILNLISTDFSSAIGLKNQTETTRLVLASSVQTHDDTLDTDGRPKGWTQASPAQTVDVPVTLNTHVGVPIVFGQHLLSSTMRNLFAEQSDLALNALGGYVMNSLLNLVTAANFNAYAGNSAAAGATTDGSTTITVTSTANMYPGQEISGDGIPTGTYVRSVTNATTAVLTRAATATDTGKTFTLNGGKVPTTHATYVKASSAFDLSCLGELSAAMSTRQVPANGRFCILNPTYYSALTTDSDLNPFFLATRSPETITGRALPELQTFKMAEAPYFPSTSNRVGFAGHKASLLLKTRLPVDFVSASGAQAPGKVSTVTAINGLTVALIEYIDLQRNYAEWRPEVLFGVAKGDTRCGIVLTSA